VEVIWFADNGYPNETRCEINGLDLHVWRHPAESDWWLYIRHCGIHHQSPHRTRREARDTGIAIAELLTKGKRK
jgi:hypothetical protein